MGIIPKIIKLIVFFLKKKDKLQKCRILAKFDAKIKFKIAYYISLTVDTVTCHDHTTSFLFFMIT